MSNNIAAWISEKWASMLQWHLYESFVWSFIANTKFEWMFDWADTVHFPRLAKISTNDLASSYDSVTIQDIVEADETFVLDTRKHFAVSVSNEDYKEMLVNPNPQILKDWAQAFANDYDTKIMSEYANAWIVADDATASTATNWWAWNPVILSKTNIYDFVTWISQLLDEANVPAWDRFLIVSPAEKRLFANSPDLVRDTSKWDSIVTWWFMWTIDNFSIYYSNNIQAANSVKHLLAWQWKPVSFAANIKPSVEVTESKYRDSFTNLIKAQTKFWVKTFAEWAERLVDVQVSI